MNARQRTRLALGLTGSLLIGVLLGLWWARSHHSSDPLVTYTPLANNTPDAKAPVLYWYDPMKPEQHFDKPGKSPFMDMALLPKYAVDAGAGQTLSIDPRTQQNLGIRIATAESGQLREAVTATGVVQWNERRVAIVQARAAGFVDRVYDRAPGDLVHAGTPLVDLLVPDWLAAQREFLVLRQYANPELVSAGRQRLRLLGMPDDLIAELESTGQPRAAITISAPLAGVIQSVGVRQGMTVTEGMTLAEIKGTDPVWVEAAVPESQAGLIAVGATGQVALTAYPGRTISGAVAAILPAANADTRTLRVRLELPNHDGRLREGMLARVSLEPRETRKTVLIPTEAIIRTGARTLVILALPEGHFEPVEVQVGRDAGSRTEVLEGLEVGQRVVASGQFLIDSEANLRDALSRMGAQAAETALPTVETAPRTSASATYDADGTVESITRGKIVISHSPVRSLGWGAMTMPFRLAEPELAQGVQVGDRVHFRFRELNGQHLIERLDKSGSAP